jgi:Zn-dependent protease
VFGDPLVFVISSLFLIPAALIAIPVHELGHGYAALAEGDPTPRNRGFLRADPRLFIEPYGLIAVFLANVGWGARIPINEYRLRGWWGKIAYALAGPVANLVLAVITGLALRQTLAAGGLFRVDTIIQSPLGYASFLLYALFFLNLSMFAFNLLPIPGLDGWQILEALFLRRNPRFFFNANMNRRQIWMVAILVVFAASLLARVSLLGIAMAPFFQPLSTLIFGTCIGYPGLTPCLR